MSMIYVEDLLAAGATLHGAAQARSFSDWSYDSRLATPGSCFVALRTARADGHDHIAAAVAASATGVLCRWPPAATEGVTVLTADDPQALLQRWAAARLAAVAPLVVGVTGSVGKTATCRAVAAVLQALGPTFQSRRSFNSLLGLPIAMAHLEDGQRHAVLEYGSDRPGEIARLAALFPPRVAIVTAVGEAHLRGFGSLAGVAAEKAALVAALPADGVAVLNGDDPLVRAMAAAAPTALCYGFGPDNDLRGEGPRYDLGGTALRLRWRGETADAWTSLVGRPGACATMAAVAAGLACGMSLQDCVGPLGALAPPAGRLRPLPGRGGLTVLDDSYSAAPPSTRAALETLAALPARRRVAVLGASADLPRAQEEAFARVVGALAAHSADALILKGDWGVAAAAAASAARPDLPVSIVDTAEGAVAALPPDLGPGDLVLVKGGPEARMERVVAQLVELGPTTDHRPPTTDGEDTDSPGVVGRSSVVSDMLVRQEPAWRSVRVGAPDRPTWLRVDLDAVAANVRRLRSIAGVPLMIVLKADGYGHGAARVARAALGAGAASLAVATLGEARALRERGVAAPILVLGYLPPWQAEEALRLGLDCAVYDDDGAQALSAAGAASGLPARIHVKVDTGMARLGLRPDEAGPFLSRLRGLPSLQVVGIYTHFASADAPSLASAEAQLAAFGGLLRELEASGLRPPVAHAANSAAALRLPAARLDMVRPGIACYGLAPGEGAPLPAGFRPALSFHSEVAQLKDHPPGAPISYGGTFITARPSQIATIPVGYADGLRRSPAWREVLVRGRRAPIVGRIAMDYAMIDVTAIPGVRRGDPVVLIGAQGDDAISADEVAGWLGTISYEVITGILPRVPREVGE
jgi:alanine racemase